MLQLESEPLIKREQLVPLEVTTTVRSRHDPFLDRVMRVAVFQMASAWEGWLEHFIYEMRRRQVFNASCCSSKGSYNPARCLDSRQILIELGGEEFRVLPGDREAVIKGVYFNPVRIKEKIEGLGGSWEKIEHEGSWYFVIRGPEVESAAWNSFSTNILERMYWKKAPWDPKLIITGENVGETRPIGENKKGVLLVDVTVPWPMHRREIGKFIGLGCHVAVNNARGIEIDPRLRNQETGVITEATCYEDLLSVLNDLKKHELSSWILRGNCLNAAIGVHLIAQCASEGICAFLDNVPKSPREILEGNPKSLRFYDAHVKAIQSLPGSYLSQNHNENGFDSMKILEEMKACLQSSSRVLFVGTVGDPATPPEKVKEVFDRLITKLPSKHCKYFEQDLSQFEGERQNQSAHMASSIENPVVREIFLRHFGMTY